MSGFVALVERDGRPVDQQVLERLTDAMVYRGPDRQATWRGGELGGESGEGHPGNGLDFTASVGLGHAAFHTLEAHLEAPQPTTLDRRLWISTDARIDDREQLCGRLADEGRPGLEDAADALLLLHSYDTWGAAMLERIIGDFAFALWDAAAQSLFCARDHFGVKPLYYAEAGSTLLVGNTIESLRDHPEVGDRLDELAIADYLLFGYNRHAERTSFAEIRRLPPAHSLTWQRAGPGSLSVDRYWRLHVSGELRFADETQCVERFDELLSAAVADRVRGDCAAVLMSGGLDSTSVAALAHEVMTERYDGHRLAACTFAFEELIDDPEPEHAAEVAAALGIPCHRLPLDLDRPDDLWGETASWSAEPTDLPASARIIDLMHRTVPGTRVGFTGQGADPALHVTPEDAKHRATRDGWLRTSIQMGRYAARHGHLPRSGLRTALRRRFRGRRFAQPPAFPPWILPELADRLQLRRRHEDFIDRQLDESATRPEAEFQLGGPEWSFLLEWYDAGMTGFAAELRHPFLDVRVVEFLLAIPPIPWLVEKELIRRAMVGRLPESTLARRKTPVGGYAIHETLMSSSEGTFGLSSRDSGLAEFIDVESFTSIARRPERLRPWEYGLITRPLGLALWLSRLETGAPRGTENTRESGRQDAAEERVPQA